MDFLSHPTEHAAAVSFLKGLPTVDRDTFNRLPDEFKAASFLITGITAHDVLQDVRDMVAGIPQGEDFETTRLRIQKRIAPLMGGNDKAAAARSLIIARHWTGKAYNSGQAQQLDNHLAAFPFRKRLSVGDGAVRPSHAALSGLILPADSPFWNTHTPPDAHNCRCMIVGVTRAAMQRKKDAEEAAGIEADKRTVLEGPLLKKLENDSVLVRGMTEIYPLKDEPGAISWNPKELLMPVAEIEKRYDKQTWSDFQTWAKGKDIAGRSLWERLNAQREGNPKAKGQSPKAATAPVPKPAPPVSAPAPAAAPAPATARPASSDPAKQISAHVAVKVKSGPVAKAAKESLASIAKVHSDGGLKDSPLASKSMSDAYGCYQRWRGSTTDGFRSEVKINPKGDHATLTTLHELGHKIDFEAIAVYDQSGRPVHTFHAAALAVRARILAALKAGPRAQAIAAEPAFSVRMRGYALSDVELFARSYAQYITVRSGSAAAAADLAHELASKNRSALQWPEAEFAPIADLFDELFKTLGWQV